MRKENEGEDLTEKIPAVPKMLKCRNKINGKTFFATKSTHDRDGKTLIWLCNSVTKFSGTGRLIPKLERQLVTKQMFNLEFEFI